MKNRRSTPGNRFRIIGGEWRGRRFSFAPEEQLRPSPDRVRETLFNWLANVITGARCLDLFAGSGALGLEALSRGARTVTFVDRNARAIDDIADHLARLKCTRAELVRTTAASFLAGATDERFDVVFLDPPYRSGLLGSACAAVAGAGVLNPRARIYLECAAKAGAPALPEGWTLERTGRAGRVGYHLAISRPPGKP